MTEVEHTVRLEVGIAPSVAASSERERIRNAAGLVSFDAVNYGIYVTNSVPDHGDAVLRDFYILAGPNNNPAAALKWDSGGGLKILGGKVSWLSSS